MSTSHQNRSSTIFSSSTTSAGNVQSPATGTMGSGPNLSISSNTASNNTTMVAGGTTTQTPNSKMSISHSSSTNKSAVVLQASLKKLKTMKKKYFVLYHDTKDGEARLEYYDSEKKFKAKAAQPKRKILLKNAKIQRRLDTKHKCVVSIHNENESFCIVFDSEPELNTWYRACVAIQNGKEISDTQPKSTFEHVWQVQVQKKGLAVDKGIIGNYNVCLTEKTLSLTRVGPTTTITGESRMPNVEFLLMTIRRCGFTQIYFYLEVGRHSAIGSGELWMETEDALIAENMYTLIYNAMSDNTKNRDDIQPVSRIRSSSESSKPIPVKTMRQSHTGNKPLNMSLSPTGENPRASCSSTTSSTTSNSTLIHFPSNSNNSSSNTNNSNNNNNNSNNTKNAPIFSNNQDNPVVNPTSTNFQSNQQQQDLIKNHHVLSAFNCATNTATSTTSATTIITRAITSCNPQYPSTAPLRPLGSQRRHSVSVGSTAACHQRAFSLPSGPMLVGINFYQNNNNNNSGNNQKITSTTIQNNNNNNNNNNNPTAHSIQPIHQRTRSLPLSEETAIQLLKPSSSITMNHNASLSLSTSGITSTRCSCLMLNKIQNTCTIHNYKSCSFLQQQTSNSHNNNNIYNNYNLNNNLISNNNNNNNYELNNNNNKSLPPSLSSTSIISKLAGNIYSAAVLLQSPSSNATSSSVSSHHHIANSMDSIIEDNDHNIDEMPASNTIPNSLSSDEQGFSMIRSLTKSAGIKMSSGASPSSLRRCRNASASWSTMGRERCDSLPTRNRTTSESSNQSIQSAMPPPRTIHSNRPHSMYINRFNNSPPHVNSYPLSPSGTCSESDGSSFSIDETDGIMHAMITDDEKTSTRGGFGQIIGSTVILEENPDDIMYNERPLQYDKASKTLVLPISQNQSYGQRKGSPAPRIGSVEGNNYMDMYSPISTSPGDPTNAYMSMLPGSPGIDYSRGIYMGSSGAHSRASSIAEDPIDGYVPMLPPQPDDYVDMDQPPLRNYHHHPSNSMSSAASSCSITSGTPSTDMRFAEYHLDKVTARFTPDDEDQSSITERPIRAYSVGSKLEHNKRKFRVEILTAEHQNSRVRAFSVGSRAKVPRSDLYRGVLTPSQTTIANTPESTQNVTRGKKSSSAPILNMKGNSLIDPMDDLMEIDYSKKDDSCSTPISNAELCMIPPIPIDVDDLMEIDFSDARSSTVRKLNTPTTSLPVPVPNSSARRFDRQHLDISPKMGNNFSGYVEMRPQMHTSDPVAIAQKNIDNAYLNMRPIGVSSLSKSPSLSSSPIKSMNSPKTVPLTATLFSSQSLNKSNYADMSSRSLDKIRPDDKSISASSPKTISDEYLNTKPEDIDSKSSDLPKTVSAPEGYMEMNWGKESRAMTNATNEKPTENYMNVGFSRLASSQPIAIRPSGQNYSTFASSNVASASPGQTTRVRCDSKDSGIVTPSGSQAAIFPFSPSSPMKNVDPLDRKCFVDGTTGTIRLSEEDEQDYMKSNETSSKNQTPTQVDDLSSNYATMTIEKKKVSTTIVEGPDYINVSPVIGLSNTPLKTVSPITTPQFDDGSGDYTFVDPKKIKTQTSIPNYQIPMKKSILVTVNHNQDRIPSFGGFKPISSNVDEKPISSTKLTSDVSSLLNRQLSEKREHEGEQCVGGYEILRNENKKMALSRPNSVNSEKISSKNSSSNSSLNRPNSANSDRIPFISTSTSSSTLCGSSSSSSTLCGSKSQSPSSASTTPRPQSLGDIGTSRPESVSSMTDTHVTSRPPSVSLERELHYASLDLPPCDDSITIKNPLTPGGCESSASASPSPITGCTGGANSSSSSANSQQSAFTYAQIDFVKITKQSTKSN